MQVIMSICSDTFLKFENIKHARVHILCAGNFSGKELSLILMKIHVCTHTHIYNFCNMY